MFRLAAQSQTWMRHVGSRSKRKRLGHAFPSFLCSSGNNNLLLRKLLSGRCWASSEIPWFKGNLHIKRFLICSFFSWCWHFVWTRSLPLMLRLLMVSSGTFHLFPMCFSVLSRNCLLTIRVYLRGKMAAKPAMKCAWLQLCRKVRFFKGAEIIFRLYYITLICNLIILKRLERDLFIHLVLLWCLNRLSSGWWMWFVLRLLQLWRQRILSEKRRLRSSHGESQPLPPESAGKIPARQRIRFPPCFRFSSAQQEGNCQILWCSRPVSFWIWVKGLEEHVLSEYLFTFMLQNGIWQGDAAIQATQQDYMSHCWHWITLPATVSTLSFFWAVYPNVKYRLTLPTRTREGCLRNTDVASLLALSKPIKKARATGLKIKGQLLKGEPINPQQFCTYIPALNSLGNQSASASVPVTSVSSKATETLSAQEESLKVVQTFSFFV